MPPPSAYRRSLCSSIRLPRLDVGIVISAAVVGVRRRHLVAETLQPLDRLGARPLTGLCKVIEHLLACRRHRRIGARSRRACHAACFSALVRAIGKSRVMYPRKGNAPCGASSGYAAAPAILCTVPTPTPNSAAILCIPLPPACSAAWMLRSTARSIFGRPIGLPLLVPLARARARPAHSRAPGSWRAQTRRTRRTSGTSPCRTASGGRRPGPGKILRPCAIDSTKPG
jgi:hypothetical protein